MNSENPTTTDTPTNVGIFWRTSLKPFTPIHPGIMTFSNGRVSFKTKDEQVFESDIAQISAVFTLVGTLVLTVDGVNYSFIVGSNTGIMHKPFSPEQIKELQESTYDTQDGRRYLEGFAVMSGGKVLSNMSSSIGGQISGVAGRAAGLAIMYRENYNGFKIMMAWTKFLEEKGLKVTYKVKSYAKMQLALYAIIVPSIAVFCVLFVLVVFAFVPK